MENSFNEKKKIPFMPKEETENNTNSVKFLANFVRNVFGFFFGHKRNFPFYVIIFSKKKLSGFL
jgi:hypothetical protein